MAKKATMEQIAKSLGISKSLVSRAVNDKYGVSDETRSQIKTEALRLGYQLPQKKPAARTGSVTLIVEGFDRYEHSDTDYWMKIMSSIERHLKEHGISVFLSMAENIEGGTIPLSLRQMKSDGVIMPGVVPIQSVLAIASLGVPIVLVDSNHPNFHIDQVLANNHMGTHEATEYLLAEGHRKIGFIGSTGYSFSFSERFRGFLDCMTRHGLAVPEAWRITGPHDEFVVPFAREQLRRLMACDDMPTAFLCGNDITAFIACEMMQAQGRKIPEDVSVIGFDNIHKAGWVSPPLTSVNVHKEQMGEEAVELMLRRIRNPQRSPQMVLVDTNIVRRESVRRQ